MTGLIYACFCLSGLSCNPVLTSEECRLRPIGSNQDTFEECFVATGKWNPDIRRLGLWRWWEILRHWDTSVQRVEWLQGCHRKQQALGERICPFRANCCHTCPAMWLSIRSSWGIWAWAEKLHHAAMVEEPQAKRGHCISQPFQSYPPHHLGSFCHGFLGLPPAWPQGWAMFSGEGVRSICGRGGRVWDPILGFCLLPKEAF